MAENKENTKNQAKFYKKPWFWVIIVVAVIAIGAIAGSGNKDGKVGTVESSDTQQVESKDIYAVGDEIKVGDIKLAVTSVNRNYSTGDSYTKPKDGNEFIKINISLENLGDSTESYNSLDYEVQTAEGDIVSYSIMAQADDALNSGSLAAGGKKKASIVFEVPKGDENLILHYKDNYFSDKTTQIKL